MKVRRTAPLATRLERLVLGPRLQLQVPGPVLGPREEGLCRAGAAVRLAEQDADARGAGPLDQRAPGRGQLAFWAAYSLVLPVNLEPLETVAALELGLPARVGPGRADQGDAELLAAAHHQPG